MPPDASHTDRLKWIDIARGLSIFLVVVIHTDYGVFRAHVAEMTPGWDILNNVGYTFMVSVFFFVSGWLVESHIRPAAQRIARIGTTILYPYLFWMTLQMGIVLATQSGNHELYLWQVPHAYVYGWGQFWFLRILMLIQLLDVAYRWCGVRQFWRVLIAFGLLAIWMTGVDIPLGLERVCSDLIYFELGIVLCRSSWKPAVWQQGVMVMVGVAVLVAYIAMGFGMDDHHVRPVATFAGVGATVALAMLLGRLPSYLTWLVCVLGRRSLEIYVAQIIFAAGMRVALLKCGVEGVWVHMILGVAAGLFGPLLLVYVNDRWLGLLFRFEPGKLRRMALDDRKRASTAP